MVGEADAKIPNAEVEGFPSTTVKRKKRSLTLNMPHLDLCGGKYQLRTHP